MVTDQEIERAAEILRNGGLVGVPTETVYGLAADASNPAALKKIFTAKGRPADHPLIVHIADMSELKHWAAEVPRAAWMLAEKFWPGPLTMVLKSAPHVSELITGGQNTIAVRVPGHPVALKLLQAFGGGVAAPSANKFGKVSPTTAAHVREEFGSELEVVLDGGACEVGIESTIVDVTRDPLAILRPGRISAQQIADALLAPVAEAGADRPRVPGALASHYAPRTPLRLVSPDELEAYVRRLAGTPVAVVARRSRPRDSKAALWQVAPELPHDYEQHLYAMLRRIDAAGCSLIVVETVPLLPEWAAVRDRIGRAATPQPQEQSLAANGG